MEGAREMSACPTFDEYKKCYSMNRAKDEADIPIEFSRQQELNPALVRIHKLLLIPYVIIWLVLALIPVVSGVDVSLKPAIFSTACFIVPILLHFFAMRGAREGKKWGCTLSKLIGIICLPGFPVLTTLGIYILRHTGERWMSANS
ncbi:hypothetical protein [Undibacterium sp. Tian12W]|uniref:hypothetical protein n=1 Tax=Undibacterium sp. Tian12W TaxID=3413054 RepID=UPI003BF17739